LTFGNQGDSGAISHTYADNLPSGQPYTITVTVTDKDGAASDPATTQLMVNNVPPTVESWSGPNGQRGRRSEFGFGNRRRSVADDGPEPTAHGHTSASFWHFDCAAGRPNSGWARYNNGGSGAVYQFDRLTGQPILPTLTNPGGCSAFGNALAVMGENVLVGSAVGPFCLKPPPGNCYERSGAHRGLGFWRYRSRSGAQRVGWRCLRRIRTGVPV